MSDAEFDDFGGFEAAEPEPLPEVSSVTPGVADSPSIPLSVVDGAASTGQSATDISSIPWLAASLNSSLASKTAEAGASDPDPTIAADTRSKYAALSSNDAAGPSISWTSTTEVLPQTTNNKTSSDVTDTGNTSPQPPSKALSSERVDVTSQQLIAGVQKELSDALAEKHRLRSDAIEYKLQNESLQKQLDEMSSQLEQQRDRYAELQKTHEEELRTVKESNSAAVALIIQEYKEHNKLATLEVQKSCCELFSKQMKMESDKFEQLFREQTSHYDLWREETERATQGKITEALQSTRADLQKDFEQEKQSIKSKMEAHLKTIEAKIEALKSDLVKEITNQTQQNLAQLETQSKAALEELSMELRATISTSSTQQAEKERAASLEHWEKCSREMMEKFQASLRQAVEQQRVSVDAYIREKVKADTLTQKTQLSAIDVYLEAARQHLKSLTDQSDNN